MNKMHRMWYRSPDDQGSGGQTTETTGQTTQTTGDDDAARIADFQSQLKRHQGDVLRYAERLHERNYALRRRAQEAEAKLPKDDQAIITTADLNALKAYKELGSATEIATERAELERLRNYQMVSTAAQVSGMNPKVLSKLLPGGAVLNVGEATDDEGQAKQAVYVVEGEKETLLDEYAESNWKEFLPALKAGEETASGKTWIQQQGSTGGDAGNGTNQILATRLEQLKKKQEEEPRI